MSKSLKSLLGLAVAVFCVSALSFAKSNQVNIIYKTRVGHSTVLKPGNYKVDVINDPQSPQIQFYLNGNRVAEVPAKLVNEAKKNPETEVYYNTVGQNGHVLTEIRLNGWTQNIMFPASTSASSTAAGS